ncbi:hypothetical protein BDV33DRAFT_165865 [Aspergillus novoparasiticus]|uniref:Uncharacterized protein n=1 Tax=Aspergillus novoparasiticus TaxID=986946 RepID=A0A5N6F4Q9_9EURO|nr:hypothetical protein BDV33DRAFT_165865 [Aspergillus novoparasiticus]
MLVSACRTIEDDTPNYYLFYIEIVTISSLLFSITSPCHASQRTIDNRPVYHQTSHCTKPIPYTIPE